MVSIADKPWLKAYDLGGQGLIKLAESIKPYPNVPLFSVLDNSARDYADRPAVHYMDRIIPYRELKELVDRFANALVILGIKKGDRVATILANCPQFIISDFGILKSGAVHVPCSLLHKENELIYEIGESGAETVICMDDALDLVKRLQDYTKVKRIIITSVTDYSTQPEPYKQVPGVHQFRDMIEKAVPEPPQVEIDPARDLAELIFTGGTTGMPKGVMLTHNSRMANLSHMAWAFSFLESLMRGQISWLVGVPLYHQFGMTYTQFCIFWAFEIYLVADPRDIKALFKVIKENEPTGASCVPTQYAKLLEMGLGQVKTGFVSSTAPLRKDMIDKFKEETGANIGDSYGASEMGGGTHANLSISDLCTVKKYGSIGVPMPDVEVRIIDLETGKDAVPGKEGELWVRGPQIMQGYWPTPGNGLVEDGWLPMGDVVKMDDDGYFYITDRVKDMANVSGNKVYTILVEKVLYEHPGVELAAAVAVPDRERPGSDRVKAFIVLKKDYKNRVKEEDIVTLCKEKLAAYSVPKYVEFRDELPVSPVGKILKRQLRDEEIAKAEGKK
jgi:long-chain acyl-CoA synthetase